MRLTKKTGAGIEHEDERHGRYACGTHTDYVRVAAWSDGNEDEEEDVDA